MMSRTTSSAVSTTSGEELRRMRLTSAYAGTSLLASLKLFSKASTRRRALSLMKSEYSSSRWKTFFCQQVAPILMPLDYPSAYTRTQRTYKRTKNSSKSCDGPWAHRQNSDRSHYLSSLIQNQKNENWRKIDDRSSEQLSRR